MAGIRIEGNTSGNVAEVDASNYLKVVTPSTVSGAGYVKVTFPQDDGSITGSPTFSAMKVTEEGVLSTGASTNMALYNFVTTSQNTGDIKYTSSTMTANQSGGFLNINNGLATGSGNYVTVSTNRYFSLQGDGDLHLEITGQISGMPPSNQIFEVGLFVPTAGVVPADGAFFRLTSSGCVGVISYGGTETTTSLLVTSITANTNGEYRISAGQRAVEFFMNGVLIGTISTPNAQAVPYQTMALPMTWMCRNSGVVTGGTTMKIGTAHVTQETLATYKPWSYQQAGQGNAYQGQDGDTMGSNAAYSNAALAAAAALTNTTALVTGLGGVGLILPTLTAGTDGIFCGYQNPTGSTTQPPKTLMITGVSVSMGVQTVLAGGPLNYVVGIAFGSTALSLATTETASFTSGTTKAPRRVPVGTLNCAATAAAGTALGTVSYKFGSPIVVHPGEFFSITLRNVGTVTTTGAVICAALVDHYYE